MIKNFKILVNLDIIIIIIILNEVGNYICLVKNKYGIDMKNFIVVLNGEFF